MKSLKLIFSFVLIISANIQSQWQWIHPKPQGNDLNSISNIDHNNLIAVGDFGTIIKTTDSGNNWDIIQTGLDYNLNSIYIIDENHLWICGDNGIILKSTNGGNEWSAQNSNTEMDLKTIFFLDNNNGFCAGGYRNYPAISSILLHTTNGGTDWEEIDLSTDSPINKIFFINNNVGYLCGGYNDTAILLKTTDGGANWSDQYFDAQQFTSLYFVNENIGFLTTEWNFYYKTTNGGTDWLLGNIPDNGNYFNDVYFEDENNGWIAGGGSGWGARLFLTTNGGIDWQTEMEWRSGHYSGYNDLQLIDSNFIFLVGYGGEIKRTTNGGESWEFLTKRRFATQGTPFFLNSNSGWVPAPSSIYHTPDRGVNWSGVPAINMTNIFFKDENFGYGINGSDDIGISTDGGQSWAGYSINHPGYSISLISIYNWDENNGIVWGQYFDSYNGGIGNLLAKTSQGWSSYTLTWLPGYYISAGTAYTNYAWGAGPDGLIIRSSNYGNSWESINTVYSQNLHKIFALNSQNVWILGDNVLLKSTDTGLTWSEISVPGNYVFQDIQFTDVNHGWLLVSQNWSKILYTSDGGNLWNDMNLQSEGYLNSIQVIDDNYLFAYGDDGKILSIDHPTNTNWDFNNYITEDFVLSQNYPNPFNPSTKIKYSVPQLSNVIIKVFDILGNQIETLVNEEKSAGTYEVNWNASSTAGRLPSGVYFYRIQATPKGGQAGDPSTGSGQVFIQTKKMLLLK